MAEVFGLISFALGALAAADRAVVLFDRLQNAPKQMRLVWILLDQIKEDLNTLRESNNDDSGGPRISPATFKEIKDALTECEVFLDRYSERFSSRVTLRRVFWSAIKAAELEGIRSRIAYIYPQIITPLNMRVLISMMPAPATGEQNSPMLPAQVAQAGVVGDTAPSPYGIAATADGVQALVRDSDVRQDGVRQAEEELKAALSIKLRDILETNATIEMDDDLKILQRATLTLQGDDIPLEYQTLKLDGLEVAARDEKTIMLRFSCNGGSIRIKHLVPFSTPPCLSAVESPDVYFRATHSITLLLDDGHLLLHVATPRYHFNDFRVRRKFQELVRARKLVAEIESVEVMALFNDNDDGRMLTSGTTSTKATSISGSSTSSGSRASKTRVRKVRRQDVCLAQSEPLQIWQPEGADQPGCSGPGIVTVTFLADTAELSGGGGSRRDKWRVLEWHAEDLGGRAEVVAKAAEMWWAIRCVGAAPGVRITFRSKREARRFAELFKPPDREEALGVDVSAQVQSHVGARPQSHVSAQVRSHTLPLLAPIGTLDSIETEWSGLF